MKVVVTGDVTMDWHLRNEPSLESGGDPWMRFGATRAFCQRGGAALLADLIKKVASRLKPHPEVFGPKMPKRSTPDDSRFGHAFAMYREFPKSAKDGEMVWRAADSLGLTRRVGDEKVGGLDCRRLESDDPNADLVVLDDAGYGFRDAENEATLWPKGFTAPKGNKPWVILKMSGQVLAGPLWKRAVPLYAERLIVVIPAWDLRGTKALVSRGLSWESTALDVVKEWHSNTNLQKCAHVIVSFGAAGAIHLRSGSSPPAQLYFDPQTMENQWEEDLGGKRIQGGMYGYGVTLTAAIAHEIMKRPAAPDFGQAIQRGVTAIRDLYVFGNSEPASKKNGNQSDNKERALEFPHASIASAIVKSQKKAHSEKTGGKTKPVDSPILAVVDVPTPDAGANGKEWTILATHVASQNSDAAEAVAWYGLGENPKVPIGRFGKLLTVDRREIEALRSIRSLIEEYRVSRSSKPLSIAVFGPPGSGKSFGVREVGKAILGDSMVKLTFNLSQFGDPSQFVGAFHQIRDVGLSGKTPLVFWDEFDSSLNGVQFGWLRYFLAPMQDGEFQESGVTHPIGHSIFVFAGGTAETEAAFGANLKEDVWKAVKGPDFRSRLRGFLNIPGLSLPPKGKDLEDVPEPDLHCRVRRAILLRSQLNDRAKHLFEKPDGAGTLGIDVGVLRAFLKIPKFNHSARSMEAILAMSVLSGRRVFERSCLPSVEQLNLHVNGAKFLEIVQEARAK